MSRSPRFCVLVGWWLVLGAGAASGRTWIVDPSGEGDFTRVTDACQAAAAGDTVAVQPGSYDEYDGPTFTLRLVEKPISLIGLGEDPANVRLRMSIWFSHCFGTLIRNVTFHDEHCPIVEFSGSLVVERCRFEDNTQAEDLGAGGAIRQVGWNARIEDCVFLRNTAEVGGAFCSSGEQLEIRRCVFQENRATIEDGGGLRVFNDRGTVEDCLFLRNVAPNGAALSMVGSDPTIVGSTFYANETTTTGGAALAIGSPSDDTVRQCIVAGTVNGIGVGTWDSATLVCFCFWDNELGNGSGWIHAPEELGNFTADPRFCNPDAGDFHLFEGSPCLPGEHGGYSCGLIGALGLGCGEIPTQETTWGRIKERFRGAE